jgi:hypothetical protein
VRDNTGRATRSRHLEWSMEYFKFVCCFSIVCSLKLQVLVSAGSQLSSIYKEKMKQSLTFQIHSMKNIQKLVLLPKTKIKENLFPCLTYVWSSLTIRDLLAPNTLLCGHTLRNTQYKMNPGGYGAPLTLTILDLCFSLQAWFCSKTCMWSATCRSCGIKQMAEVIQLLQ